jgi:hypothetical protein
MAGLALLILGRYEGVGGEGEGTNIVCAERLVVHHPDQSPSIVRLE